MHHYKNFLSTPGNSAIFSNFYMKTSFYFFRFSLANEVQSIRDFFLQQAGPFVFPVHTSRSHFTANSGLKETPTTPSETNSVLQHVIYSISRKNTQNLCFLNWLTTLINLPSLDTFRYISYISVQSFIKFFLLINRSKLYNTFIVTILNVK